MTSSSGFYSHPTAVIDDGAQVGHGSKVWHFCHLMNGAHIGEDCVLGQNVYVAASVRIGDGCRIQNNVSLYDGVQLASKVFVGPSAVFTNVSHPRAAFPRWDQFEPTIVGEGATIGANATIVCGVSIGPCAFIGAGSVVTTDVPAHALVVGVPAHPVGWVCACGERLHATAVEHKLACAGCERSYQESHGEITPLGVQ